MDQADQNAKSDGDVAMPVPGPNAGKRSNGKRRVSDMRGMGGSTPQKRRKPNTNVGEGGEQLPQTKNTVAVLNELRRNLVYKLESQSGPVHAPVFTMSVLVDGQTYMGRGRSKKIARIEAAAAALRSFIQFKDGATLTPIKPMQNVDFTSDDPMIENGIFTTAPIIPPLTSNATTTTSTVKSNTTNTIATKTTTTPSVRANLTPPPAESSPKKSSSSSGNSNNADNSLILPNQIQNQTQTILNSNQNENSNFSGRGDVVQIIQQSLDLFKNNNENLAWAKRLEKISKQATSTRSQNGHSASSQKSLPDKGPVMLLHELFSDVHFECVSSDGLQHSKFKVAVTVNEENRFEGTGPSKKMAKNAAAKAALASLCDISFSPLQQLKLTANTTPTSLASGQNCGIDSNYDSKNVELPQTFADCIGKHVIEKFNEVMKGNDVYARRKVLAGFVMTTNYDMKTAKVITLATGTKCVSGEHMSVTGCVINDSHAEIIARRGLIDFFYTQLEMHCNNNKNGKNIDSIFYKQNSTGLFKLKENIYFHLYINTAPCGDARVFSPHENDDMDVDKHPNRKARGQLRTKVESGEGTIPVKSSEGIQTWDGVLQGQRLLTMSCSDKISRWNVLGVQGSLLSAIIEPVYLHSIVLGSLLHPAHMYRAICGRVENSIQGLPPPYRLNKPRLALMTSAESRNQTKPPNFSINWIIDNVDVEIVNSFTGKLINNNTNTNKMSRLSKQSFYNRFDKIIKKLPSAKIREILPTYGETKGAITEYQQAKRELFSAFAKEDLGDWLKKPIEQDQFTLMPLPAVVATIATSNGESNGNSKK